MIDNGPIDISDEMLAAWLDGNSTPLERVIIGDSLSDESVVEISDLTADCRDAELMEGIEPIRFADIIDDLTRPFRDYRDLKDGLDMPDETSVM